MTSHDPRFARRTFLAAMGVGLAASGCGARASSSRSGTTVPGASFVFAGPAAPASLDPSVNDSLETSRISSQILEGLVTADPSTGEPAPGLAESWEFEDGATSAVFHLRKGVGFHDGSALDAHAVCANFEKWRAQAEADTPWASRTPFATVFRHGRSSSFASSSYGGCEANGEHTVRLSLRHRYSPLLQALTQPSFGIAAPQSIRSGTEGERPVGTGPFRFASADAGAVRLDVNPDYWGGLGDIGSLEFRAIADPAVRYAALVSGQVDAYDQVGLPAFAPLARSGTQVLYRDPYSVSYVGLNQRVPVLRDPDVRRAVAAALDRGAIAREHFPNGTKVADQFVPARFNVDGANLEVPSFDPQRAKELLAGSAYRGESLKFYYPRNTTRIYLQQPERVFADLAAQLTRVGFTVEPVPVDWHDDYVGKVTDPESDHALSLLGWSGTFRDPDNFLGPLFASPQPQFGFHDAGLVTAINRAAAMAGGESRSRAYRGLNERISRLLPAIPLAHPVSAVAVSDRVTSFPLTSTGYERFNDVHLRPA